MCQQNNNALYENFKNIFRNTDLENPNICNLVWEREREVNVVYFIDNQTITYMKQSKRITKHTTINQLTPFGAIIFWAGLHCQGWEQTELFIKIFN